VSVSFDYEVWTLQHFFSDSSWANHPTEKGVGYSIDVDQSAELSTFTYVGGDLTETFVNFSVQVYCPSDWENATVYDPFMNDVTGFCSIQSGLLVIPVSILDRLGWWEIDLQSHNYARSLTTQIYNDQTGSWSDATRFWSGNVSRAQLEIGEPGPIAIDVNHINVTWISPDHSEWSQDTFETGVGGLINTSQRTLGGLNTTAGEWNLSYIWTNGSEIAYGVTSFEVYHHASASVFYPSLETNYGLTVSNLISYQDTDNGNYLLDDTITIAANWSASTVNFTPNFAQNWWEADFDTSIIGAGQYTVIVNVSRPFYNNITCQFDVISTYSTDLDLPSIETTPVEVGLNEVYLIEINYVQVIGSGIDDANITISHSGPALGLDEGVLTDLGNGDYTVEITGILSQEYEVTVTASKDFHEEVSATFMLIVGEIDTTFIGLNETANLVEYGEVFHLVLHYTNSTGAGLNGATVEVVDVSPSSGLDPGISIDQGDGYYSFDLSPTTTGTYTLVIKANLTNHVTRYFTFSLLVTQISTTLTSDSTSSTIAIDQNCTVQLTYQDEMGIGIVGADVELVDTPDGLSLLIDEIGGGVYNVTLIPAVTEATSFQISLRACLTNYQNGTAAFSLFVQVIPTDLFVLEGESEDSILYGDEYQLTLAYVRTDIKLNISTASFDVYTSVGEGLEYTIIQSISLAG
jgi:hypothetical protein